MKTAKIAIPLFVSALATLGMSMLWPVTSLAQSVVQSYTAAASIENGMIVSLVKNSTGAVQPAVSSSQGNILGVAVNPGQANVTLSPGKVNNPGLLVYVATTGTYDVLVSNQAGPIASGDYIVVSSLNGIGMKGGTTQQYVIGKATGNFDGSNNVLNTATLTTKGGKQTVTIGEVPVALAIGHNPQYVAQQSAIPSFLQRLTRDIVNKPVSTSRIIISLAILALTCIIVIVMLYSGIRNSMISIGRNPLSKHSIFRGLWQIVSIAVLIFIAGLAGIYVVLTL